MIHGFNQFWKVLRRRAQRLPIPLVSLVSALRGSSCLLPPPPFPASCPGVTATRSQGCTHDTLVLLIALVFPIPAPLGAEFQAVCGDLPSALRRPSVLAFQDFPRTRRALDLLDEVFHFASPICFSYMPYLLDCLLCFNNFTQKFISLF